MLHPASVAILAEPASAGILTPGSDACIYLCGDETHQNLPTETCSEPAFGAWKPELQARHLFLVLQPGNLLLDPVACWLRDLVP